MSVHEYFLVLKEPPNGPVVPDLINARIDTYDWISVSSMNASMLSFSMFLLTLYMHLISQNQNTYNKSEIYSS